MDKFRRVYFISFITCEPVLSIILRELAEIEHDVNWYTSIIFFEQEVVDVQLVMTNGQSSMWLGFGSHDMCYLV